MIPFSPPFIDEDVIHEVNDVLTSGWITTGPKVQETRTRRKDIYWMWRGCVRKFATSGLIWLYDVLELVRVMRLIIPAYTYAATAWLFTILVLYL
jgi:dTDP-4-amino-4,6-dideoxygalactose transaminase